MPIWRGRAVRRAGAAALLVAAVAASTAAQAQAAAEPADGAPGVQLIGDVPADGVLDPGKTYTLTVLGADAEGVARIDLELAGNGVQEGASESCTGKRCRLSWPLVPYSFPAGTYSVTARVTNVGGHQARQTIAMTLPGNPAGDVVHATVRFTDRRSKSRPFLEEWAKLGTWTARAVSESGVETRDAVPCPGGGACAEYRFRAPASTGDLTAKDSFFGQRGTSIRDERILSAGLLRFYVADTVVQRPVRRGPIADVLVGGQTRPPDAGAEYELYEERDTIDNGGTPAGGDDGPAADAPGRHAVLVRVAVDERTKLPLRETVTAIADGSLYSRLVWSYTPQRLFSAQLSPTFFTLEEPARPRNLFSVAYESAPAALAKDRGGRAYVPAWLGTRKTIRGATYCVASSSEVRSIARPWPGQKPRLEDGPTGVATLRAESTYRRVQADGRCPVGRAADLTIASTARAGTLARAWRRSIVRRGGRRVASRRAGFRGTGLLVKTGRRSRALYLERGATAILVHGRFAARDVRSLVRALRAGG